MATPKEAPMEPPAMGERRARWGLAYQDKVATKLILDELKRNLTTSGYKLTGVRLADLEAGKVDDFVLVWEDRIAGHSLKWSAEATPLNWGELIGASGLLKELADGLKRLRTKWKNRSIKVVLITNRTASTETHKNQIISTHSVATFFQTHWNQNSGSLDETTVEAWKTIGTSLGLDNSELADLVSNCDIHFAFQEPPNVQPGTRDANQHIKEFNALNEAISTWIGNFPEQEEIDTTYLFDAINFRLNRINLVQRFPSPSIPYEQNNETARKLKEQIDRTESGYIGLVGSAGSGKSTLVQDVLGSSEHHFFPYYAFLPDVPGSTRDRSDPLTFFQDIAIRMERLFSERFSLGIADTAQGREELRNQFGRASNHFLTKGVKTILLIDGLDHVMREPGVTSSILHELPSPAEIPAGVIIVLGSQPQALEANVISPEISYQLRHDGGRRVEISGLSRVSVHAIATAFEPTLTEDDKDILFDSSKGNPLILTYALKAFRNSTDQDIGTVLEELGSYEGDIEQYYAHRFLLALGDPHKRDVLGLLSRAAPTLPVQWLQTWQEHILVENLIITICAPFVRLREGNYEFIHNSLVSYLRDSTRSRLEGADVQVQERSYYSRLAERVGVQPCSTQLGQARIFFLLKAGEANALLETLSGDWLREALEKFVPYQEIRPLISAGLQVAWSEGEFGQFTKLLLLDHELSSRSVWIEPKDLAERLLKVGEPELALRQIFSVGRLFVEHTDALHFARRLWYYGQHTQSVPLQLKAKALYEQAKPIGALFSKEPIDLEEHDGKYSVLLSWCRTAPLFEPLDTILSQIDQVQYAELRDGRTPDPLWVKCFFHQNVLRTLIESNRSSDEIQQVMELITSYGRGDHAFKTAMLVADSGKLDLIDSFVRNIVERSDPSEDLTIKYAMYLADTGAIAEAAQLIDTIEIPRIDVTTKRQFGLSSFSVIFHLSRIREAANLPPIDLTPVLSTHDEARARVQWAARELGILQAQLGSGLSLHELTARFREIILFSNRSVTLPKYDSRENFVISQSKISVHRTLCTLAVTFGSNGLMALKEVILELSEVKGTRILMARDLRLFARLLYVHGLLQQSDAQALGMKDLSEFEEGDEPLERIEACLEFAEFLHQIQIPANQVALWLNKAAKTSAGAGSHKDYHLAHLTDWLALAIPHGIQFENFELVEKFARCIEVAGGSGTTNAAESLIQLVARLSPKKATLLTSEFIERDVLNVSTALGALLIGCANSGGSIQCIQPIYEELLMLINPSPTAEEAVAVISLADRNSQLSCATQILGKINVNALSAARVKVARTLREYLGKGGLELEFDSRLYKPDRDDSVDDSSKYKLANGDVLSSWQVARLLSDLSRAADWNPNPDANQMFDWWKAAERADIASLEHFETIIAAFPPRDYDDINVLALKSKVLYMAGDLSGAREMAELAIARSQGGTWYRNWDSAKKIVSYSALMAIDRQEALRQARIQFSKDVIQDDYRRTFLLSNIPSIFDFLDIDWSNSEVQMGLGDYLDQVIEASRDVPPYDFLTSESRKISLDQSLIEFVIQFLAFPVVEVGAAARRAIARCIATTGNGLSTWSAAEAIADCVQWEHILVAIHVASLEKPESISDLRSQIEDCNRHESIAVRSIAKRICVQMGWEWQEITNMESKPIILMVDGDMQAISYVESKKLIGGEKVAPLRLYRHAFGAVKDDLSEEVQSEYSRLYDTLQHEYRWNSEARFRRWMKLVLARFWLSKAAIFGREVVLRVIGNRALTGRALEGIEDHYDELFPIYDPVLELLSPCTKPNELEALEWDRMTGEQKYWESGEGGSNWENYSDCIGEEVILGEVSYIIRAEGEWPREERRRGTCVSPSIKTPEGTSIGTKYSLTYAQYLEGVGQDESQLVLAHDNEQFVGSQYEWVAFNSNIACGLGWVPSDSDAFAWIGVDGEVRVRSLFWRNGWTEFEPPRFETSGKGWVVLASSAAIEEISRAYPDAEVQLWIERHSHGDSPKQHFWKLTKSLV